MEQRRSSDGRVELYADRELLGELAARGLLGDVPLWQLPGCAASDLVGRGRNLLVEAGGTRLVAKTLRHGGVFGPLLADRFFGPDRLLEAIALADRLIERRVPTAPVAFARIRHGPLRTTRLELATFELPGARDAQRWLAADPPPARRREFARTAGAVVRALHDAGVRHADLNLRNLLVTDGPPLRVHVIDLEGSRRVDPVARADVVANLERLLRSVEKFGLLARGITRTDLVRFLRAYTGAPGNGSDGRDGPDLDGRWQELFASVRRRYTARAPWHRFAWKFFT